MLFVLLAAIFTQFVCKLVSCEKFEYCFLTSLEYASRFIKIKPVCLHKIPNENSLETC